MDVFEAIKNRRSVRRYRPDPVSNGSIKKILEAGRWAPSGGNIQPWNFIVIRDKKVLGIVKKFSPGYFGDAPLAILICSERKRAYELGGESAKNYSSVADCAMAIQNMLLMAYALGLGTCVVKSFSSAAIREILEIPQSVVPELLVIIGHPDRMPKPPPKRPLEETTYLNKFGEKYFKK